MNVRVEYELFHSFFAQLIFELSTHQWALHCGDYDDDGDGLEFFWHKLYGFFSGVILIDSLIEVGIFTMKSESRYRYNDLMHVGDAQNEEQKF